MTRAATPPTHPTRTAQINVADSDGIHGLDLRLVTGPAHPQLG
jgi:hypothetical protein